MKTKWNTDTLDNIKIDRATLRFISVDWAFVDGEIEIFDACWKGTTIGLNSEQMTSLQSILEYDYNY